MWGIQSDECHLDQIVGPQRVGSLTWLDMGCHGLWAMWDRPPAETRGHSASEDCGHRPSGRLRPKGHWPDVRRLACNPILSAVAAFRGRNRLAMGPSRSGLAEVSRVTLSC